MCLTGFTAKDLAKVMCAPSYLGVGQGGLGRSRHPEPRRNGRFELPYYNVLASVFFFHHPHITRFEPPYYNVVVSIFFSIIRIQPPFELSVYDVVASMFFPFSLYNPNS